VKIMPTLEGGLRIEFEDDADWRVLGGIVGDAVSCDRTLAARLGSAVGDADVAADWLEFVVPELERSFEADLVHVGRALESARRVAAGGSGCLWVKREDALHWYGALNQARLALEEIHRFGPAEVVDPEHLSPQRRAPFLRSQFYCAVQSLLLAHVMD
jgi:hypothetical protein